jgi:hypothetical protein
VAAYGDNMLNADAAVMPWDEFVCGSRRGDELVFVKPNEDSKILAGGVRRFAEWLEIHQSMVAAGRALDTAEVVVAKPREIDAEWRLFVVDGQVVTGSMYRPSGDPRLPPELIGFAERVIAHWQPASVFVLDVARTERTWRIVECNCFNWSRFYVADVERIVRTVSLHQEVRV